MRERERERERESVCLQVLACVQVHRERMHACQWVFVLYAYRWSLWADRWQMLQAMRSHVSHRSSRGSCLWRGHMTTACPQQPAP